MTDDLDARLARLLGYERIDGGWKLPDGNVLADVAAWSFDRWSPSTNVAQAIAAAEELRQKGWDWGIEGQAESGGLPDEWFPASLEAWACAPLGTTTKHRTKDGESPALALTRALVEAALKEEA